VAGTDWTDAGKYPVEEQSGDPGLFSESEGVEWADSELGTKVDGRFWRLTSMHSWGLLHGALLFVGGGQLDEVVGKKK